MTQSSRFPFIVLTALFFTFGLITVLVDSLIPRLREFFELSYFQAGLVQFAFFIAYGLVSIPAGNLLHRIGYKKGLMVGLITMGVGCLLFYPAAASRWFGLFLMGYFTLAAGMTILQVAANPYVTVLGPRESAASRLTLAQAFNSLGTAIAPALGAVLILSDKIMSSEEIQALTEADKLAYFNQEASAVQSPFLILTASIIILAVILYAVKLPAILNSESKGSYATAFKQPKLALGAIGIFVYVGSEVTIGSYLVNYFLSMQMYELIQESSSLTAMVEMIHKTDISTIDAKGLVATFVIFYWSGAMVGRFVGSALGLVIKPKYLLQIFAFGAISMILISMSSQGLLAMYSILAVGFFNSIMFPTIFSTAIEDLGELKPEGSGILCTAICGGAFIPPFYGWLTDLSGFKWAFLLVIICYAYILYYGRKSLSL